MSHHPDLPPPQIACPACQQPISLVSEEVLLDLQLQCPTCHQVVAFDEWFHQDAD